MVQVSAMETVGEDWSYRDALMADVPGLRLEYCRFRLEMQPDIAEVMVMEHFPTFKRIYRGSVRSLACNLEKIYHVS